MLSNHQQASFASCFSLFLQSCLPKSITHCQTSSCIKGYLLACSMNQSRCITWQWPFLSLPFVALYCLQPPSSLRAEPPPPAGRSHYMKRSTYQLSSEQWLSAELLVVQWVREKGGEGEGVIPRRTEGCVTETQVHLLAVSTWQRVFSSRVALTLGNNVCQLPDTNVALLSNSSVSKTWGRGKQSMSKITVSTEFSSYLFK